MRIPVRQSAAAAAMDMAVALAIEAPKIIEKCLPVLFKARCNRRFFRRQATGAAL
jgi:hypothetical protein